MRNWFLARNNCCHDRVRHRCARVAAVAPLNQDFSSSSRVFRGDGPIAIATPTGRLRGESSVPDMFLLGRVDARRCDRRRRPAGLTISRGLSAARHAFSMWFLAGADGSLAVCPCGFVVGCAARGGSARMGMLGSDGPVGLLLLFWVDDAGAWGRDAALRRANQVTTLTDRPPPLPTETCRYSAPAHLAPCRAAKSAAPAEKHAGESSADLRSAAPRN